MISLLKNALVLCAFLSCSHTAVLAKSHSTPLNAISSDDGKILKGVDTPTGNPANCPTPSKYFRQLVNHTDKNGTTSKPDTFLQQYQVIDDYFKPGGPIIFYTSAEDPYSCAEYWSPYEFAIELGALVVGMEHRFFGLSCPGNLSWPDQKHWPTSALASLTLDNVLLDAVELLAWIKSTVSGAENSKVVTFGGSYGGFLTTMQRIHHPETFFAAIASSAPTKGIVSDPHDPLAYGIGNGASQTYLDASANASAKIREAFVHLRKRMANEDFAGLQKDLFLCTPPNSSTQVDSLVFNVAHAYEDLAQYDLTIEAIPQPVSTVVNKTLQEDDLMKVLGIAMEIDNLNNGINCSDWDNTEPRNWQTTPFAYICCTYVPYAAAPFATADSIFGPILPDLNASHILDSHCQGSFGINSITGGEEYQRSIHIDEKTLEASTHIFFYYGSNDPITNLGSNFGWNRPNRELSRVWITTGGAHGEDIIYPVPLDSAAMNQTRVAELNSIKEWLGMTDLPEAYPVYKTENGTDDFPGISEYIASGFVV